MAEKQPTTDTRTLIRDEKIFICFYPHPTPNSQRHGIAGDWIVSAPLKPVCPGQRVTWKALGECHLELELPSVFDQMEVISGNSVAAKVKDDAPEGVYYYEAYCNGQPAIGGSAPGVIIDP